MQPLLYEATGMRVSLWRKYCMIHPPEMLTIVPSAPRLSDSVESIATDKFSDDESDGTEEGLSSPKEGPPSISPPPALTLPPPPLPSPPHPLPRRQSV